MSLSTRNTLLASCLGVVTALTIITFASLRFSGTNTNSRRRKKKRSSSLASDSSSSSSSQHSLHHNNLTARNPESQNLLNLLYSIAEDQARKEGYIHRGITCNNCGTSPVRSTRYKCANCVDYDLCEGCEALECHLKTHVFLKIRIPIPPLANPRAALLNVFYPGKEMEGSNLTWEKLRELQQQTHFDQVELEALYEQFRSLSTVETTADIDGGIVGGIDKGTFEKCLGPLGLEKNLITERIFHFFDQDGDGVIVFGELVCGLSVLCKGSLDEKMEYAFKGYDLDNDGYISRGELRMMFRAYFQLSMELVRDVVKAMEEEMIEGFEATDLAGMPVSAAFTAPIPEGSIDNWVNGEEEEKKERDDSNEEEIRDVTENKRNGAMEKREGREEPMKHEGSEQSEGEEWNEQSRKREEWPVMEAMSQDAIEEMVERTFVGIGCTEREGYISFEEFRQYVQMDASIVSWFESLGSVF